MKHEMFTSVKPQFIKNEKWINLGGSMAPLLFFALFVSSIFGLFILYSPNPFRATPKLTHLHQVGLSGSPLNVKYIGGQSCNLFEGRWVPQSNGSLYTNYSCLTIPDSKNCFKNGRNDVDFLKWRWKPDGCELPTFDPKTFLKIVRGKTMAFIGDSVARNQLESLLCLLSQEETPVHRYKDSEDRFRTWHFLRHDFTLEMLWSRFLVTNEEIIVNGSNSGIFNLHIDRVDNGWAQRLPSLDFAIISDGHWFFRKLYLYERGQNLGCVYCNEPNITDRGLHFALRMSFRTVLSFFNQCKECKKGITAVLRTFSPPHFEHGTWNTGGGCNRTSPLRQVEAELGGNSLELRNVQLEEIERAKQCTVKRRRDNIKFEVLDVTMAMLMRPDGHPGSYWGNKWMEGYNDCVHWCLPGPIDTWSQFLMAILGKEERFSPDQ